MEKESERYISVILGNRMDRLADALADRLFAKGSSLFDRRFVIVPHEQIKEFLHFHFASKLGIAAGMQIFCVEQGIGELVSSETKRLPNMLTLSLALEEQVHLLLSSSQKSGEWAPLYAYIEGEGDKDKRIFSLSDQLSRLFLRYGLVGGPFLSEWLALPGWQQGLWQAVFSQSSMSFCAENLASKASFAIPSLKNQDLSVHLFGFSYLPPAQLSFFAQFSSMLYLFSPCAQYWDDLCSDKEKLFIQRRLDALKARPIISQEIRQYMHEHHPLLANWGKMGREFIKSLDGYSLDIAEMYEPSSPSLLGSIQNSILTLEPLVVQETHPSIQIHSAPSKLREVEVLRDVISTLLARHAGEEKPIEPRDILVLAPDIAPYAPYIHMVFGATPYAYRIEGLEKGGRSDFCQAFYHFLSFFEEPLSLSSVLKLFSFRVFQEKWGFRKDEAALIASWLERAQVRTGEKSWQEGIDRLLFGLVLSSDADHRLFPLNAIALSDVDVFDRFILCWQALKKDIEMMRSSEKKTLASWLAWIQDAALRHCASDPESEPFFLDLRSLNFQTGMISTSCFSFISIQRILRYFYTKRSGEIAAAHLQNIRFVSMQTGAARPCRIIYVLGLDEERFPRFEAMDSLCALSKSARKPYLPTKGDEDRYLFLELLCSARNYFILSYERIHPLDNKPQGPSYLLEELCAYAAQGGHFHNFHIRGPSERGEMCSIAPQGIAPAISKAQLDAERASRLVPECENYENGPQGIARIDHPYLPFEALCFAKEKPCPRAFFAPAENAPQSSDLIHLSSLRKLAKNPFQFYFNEALGIYLDEEEPKEDEERFCLPALKKYAIRKAALRSDLNKIFYDSERQGILPEGMFKQVALQTLSSEILERDEIFNKWQIDQFISIELSLHCRTPTLLASGNWIVPALSFNGQYLAGTLSAVAKQGYLVHGKQDLETLLTEWPLYLVYVHVGGMIGGFSSTLLFSKVEKQLDMPLENPLELLENYLAYYARARCSLSPLKPKWASALLLKTEEEFEKALCKEEGFYPDPYQEWMKNASIALNPKKLYAEWAVDLKTLFHPLLCRLEA